VRPEQAEDLTGPHFERKPVEGDHPVVGFPLRTSPGARALTYTECPEPEAPPRASHRRRRRVDLPQQLGSNSDSHRRWRLRRTESRRITDIASVCRATPSELPRFFPVAADLHVAPAPRAVARHVEEQPSTGRARADADARQITRGQEVDGRADDGG